MAGHLLEGGWRGRGASGCGRARTGSGLGAVGAEVRAATLGAQQRGVGRSAPASSRSAAVGGVVGIGQVGEQSRRAVGGIALDADVAVEAAPSAARSMAGRGACARTRGDARHRAAGLVCQRGGAVGGVAAAPPRRRARRRPGIRAASWRPGGWRPARRCRRLRRRRTGRARRCGPRCRCGCRPCSSARPARPAGGRAPGRGPNSLSVAASVLEAGVDAVGIEVAQREVDAAAALAAGGASARATTSRGSSGSTMALVVGVDQAARPRRAALRTASSAGPPGRLRAVGWNWTNSRSASAGAGAARPAPGRCRGSRARWSCGPTARRSRRWPGRRRGRGIERAVLASTRTPTTRRRLREQRRHRRVLEQADARVAPRRAPAGRWSGPGRWRRRRRAGCAAARGRLPGPRSSAKRHAGVAQAGSTERRPSRVSTSTARRRSGRRRRPACRRCAAPARRRRRRRPRRRPGRAGSSRPAAAPAVSTATRAPRSAARSAADSPAAPEPTTIRSNRDVTHGIRQCRDGCGGARRRVPAQLARTGAGHGPDEAIQLAGAADLASARRAGRRAPACRWRTGPKTPFLKLLVFRRTSEGSRIAA